MQKKKQNILHLLRRSRLKEKLSGLMEKGKIYLDPELRLEKVAGLLRTNRTYLSAVINEDFGESFSGFVNRYRVNESIRLMKEGSRAGLNEIAEQAGFKSFSSFYIFFKRATGQNPGEFYRNLRISPNAPPC